MPHWSTNADAENYNLSEYSDQEALSTIAAVGIGSAIRPDISTTQALLQSQTPGNIKKNHYLYKMLVLMSAKCRRNNL